MDVTGSDVCPFKSHPYNTPMHIPPASHLPQLDKDKLETLNKIAEPQMEMSDALITSEGKKPPQRMSISHQVEFETTFPQKIDFLQVPNYM